jgi:hypothetical protein
MDTRNRTEDQAELNRLVSGELSDAESLKLMERIVRDDDLRSKYNDLQTIDELIKEAYLKDESLAETAGEPATSPQGQEAQIEAILRGTVGGTRVRRKRPHPAARGWNAARVFGPWAVAAALAIMCGLLLYSHLLGPDGPGYGASRMDRGLIAHYVKMRKQLGDASMAVIWASDEVREEGVLGTAAGPDGREVILRLTVVRSDGDRSERWSVDALMRRGHMVELVTQTNRQWPASVKVSAGSGGNDRVPISIQARLTNDPPTEINNQRVLINQSEPTLVGSVTSGGYRYELFVEATVATGTGPAV